MIWRRVSLSLLLAGLLVLPATAGIFFKKGPKPDPNQRVPWLLGVVKSDKDASKRESAAEELRDYDAQKFPEMVPILLDVLQQEPNAGVRLEVVRTLARLRPVSDPVGVALEETAAKDRALRVRLLARRELMEYHLSGYHTAAKASQPSGGPAQPLQEPPLAPPVTPAQPRTGPAPMPPLTPIPAVPRTSPHPAPYQTETLPKPLPVGPDLEQPELTPPQ